MTPQPSRHAVSRTSRLRAPSQNFVSYTSASGPDAAPERLSFQVCPQTAGGSSSGARRASFAPGSTYSPQFPPLDRRASLAPTGSLRDPPSFAHARPSEPNFNRGHARSAVTSQLQKKIRTRSIGMRAKNQNRFHSKKIQVRARPESFVQPKRSVQNRAESFTDVRPRPQEPQPPREVRARPRDFKPTPQQHREIAPPPAQSYSPPPGPRANLHSHSPPSRQLDKV